MRNSLCALALASIIGAAGASFAASPTFDQLDQNKDGKLSKAEASKVEKLDFVKADKNKDGSLDRSEYEAAIG